MQAVYFKASWGNSVIASTLIISAIILASSYWPLKMARMPGAGMKIFGVTLLTLMLGIIAVTYLLSPQGYLLLTDSLKIVRPIKSIKINLAEVSGVEEVAPGILKDSARLLGCDGLWGLYGKYQNDKLGDYYLYARRNSDQVIIRGRNTFVVAPEKPAEFIQAMRQAVGVRKGGGNVK